MNYKFSNLLGAPYRGGNLVLHGNELLTPVGNRVSQVDLVQSTSQTLPFENLKQVQTLCVSPDGALMLSIDEEGKALLINRARGVLLHHFSFKGPVAVAKFSPDGKYVAVGVGRLLQVWHTPSFAKQLTPMQLHRTYGGCHDDVTALDWSMDGAFIAVASRDLTARIFSLHPIPGYKPPTLAGHKDALVGVFFTAEATQAAAALSGAAEAVPLLYTVSRDGALLGWSYAKADAAAVASTSQQQGQQPQHQHHQQQQQRQGQQQGQQQQQGEGHEDDGPSTSGAMEPSALSLAGGTWSVCSRHYFLQRGARLSAADYHAASGVLVAGFSNGLFELLQLPEATLIHSLSVSRERVSAAAFNARGDWVALGCARLGQLLVWEWRSESYVLKQQGHYYDVAATAFSPDGALLASGADDAKVKLYSLASGFCFVTFAEHSAPVSGVAFVPAGHAVLSASLDGTVRAYDLLRYRNFRTLTAPEPTQFGCLAVDPGGEVVAAGSLDDFCIYVWSLKTGRLLDVLAGHEGPVVALGFCPTGPSLASASWDHTVRTWDVYDNGTGGAGGGLEALQHDTDVLTLAWRPDGKQLAAATLDGLIHLWKPQDAELEATIDGRRDIRGGRPAGDRRSAANAAAGAAFSALAYSADGALLFAGGASKYVCVYDVAERVMLRRFQVSANRSLDGVLDEINTGTITDAGPLALLPGDDDDERDLVGAELLPPSGLGVADADMPGAAAAQARKRPVVRSRALALSPTGHAWAAATTEGLLLYALDSGAAFDPTDLTEALTPAAFHAALAAKAHTRALLIALRLGDPHLLRTGVFAVPVGQVSTVAAALPSVFLAPLLRCLVESLEASPHVEFLLEWVRALLAAHGPALQQQGGGIGAGTANGAVAPVMRALLQAVSRLHEDLSGACEGNVYLLDYIALSGASQRQQQQQGQDGEHQDGEEDPQDGQPDRQQDSHTVAALPAPVQQAKGSKKKRKKQKTGS